MAKEMIVMAAKAKYFRKQTKKKAQKKTLGEAMKESLKESLNLECLILYRRK